MSTNTLNQALVCVLTDNQASAQPVGAGFLVSPQHILTCAHVITDALKIPRKTVEQPTDATVYLIFPLVAPLSRLTAKVVKWYPAKDNSPTLGECEDIAVLELTPDQSLSAVVQPIQLLALEPNALVDRGVRMCGFPKGMDDGDWLEGKSQGLIRTGWVQIDNTSGRRGVAPGFSGTAVWDKQENAVAGMVVSIDSRDGDTIAYMIPVVTLIKAYPDLDQHSRPTNPYRGLRAFYEQDAPYFYGREGVIDQLQQLVQKKPLVVVMGASGSGKSSLVFAGVVPKLRQTGKWLIASCRPLSQPFSELVKVLAPLLRYRNETEQLEEQPKLAKKLDSGDIQLSDTVQSILQKHPGQDLLLIIDQFEELYTLNPQAVQQRFIDQLLQAVDWSAQHRDIDREIPTLTVLITMRADFMGQAVSYGKMAEALNRDHYPPEILKAMSEEELRATIEKPAAKLSVTLDAGLTDLILKELENQPGNLPLLEFALTQLWEKQRYRKLTHAAYEEIGGVQSALARHANETYATLTPSEQTRCRQIFLRLVHPGEGTGDTRQVATRDQVRDWELVRKLADKRLLVTGQDENTHQETVEVVHEALIRHWQPLQQWVKEDRKFLVWLHDLRHKEEEWRDKKDNGLLLRGFKLVEAQEMLKAYRESISEGEKALIEASRALQKKEKRIKWRNRLLVWMVLPISLLAVTKQLWYKEVFNLLFSCVFKIVLPTESSSDIPVQLADFIGRQIFRNDQSGRLSKLTTWNEGDNWASLGIGHFIWYPEDQKGPFTETFPDLVDFFAKQDVKIPPWLLNTLHCPWHSRQEFLDDSNSSEMNSLKTLMKETFGQQVLFLMKRWQQALPKMLETLPISSQRKHVREQFYRIAQTPGGIYALIDYVNFKGEGISSKERYQDQGWGLLQVLEKMSGDSIENAATEFAKAAEIILKQRIQNAPSEKNESRWLVGWKNRLDTYAEFNQDWALNTTLKFDLKIKANQSYASALVREGTQLAPQGQIDQALANYTQAQQLDPEVEIAAESWKTLCYFGNLYQQAEKVSEACERTEVLKEMTVERWVEKMWMGE